MTEGPKQNTASLSFNTCNPQWCLWRLIFFPLRRPELHTVVFWSPPAVTCHQSACWEQTWWSWWQFSGEKNQTTEIQLAVRFCFCFLLRPKDADRGQTSLDCPPVSLVSHTTKVLKRWWCNCLLPEAPRASTVCLPAFSGSWRHFHQPYSSKRAATQTALMHVLLCYMTYSVKFDCQHWFV